AVSARLATACEGVRIHVSSRDVVLAQVTPDEHYYGHFFFDGTDLEIAFRSTDDDLNAFRDPHDDSGPEYSVKNVTDCQNEWLLNLIEGGALLSLLQNLAEQLQTRVSVVQASTGTVRAQSASPTVAIATAFMTAASALGYD